VRKAERFKVWVTSLPKLSFSLDVLGILDLAFHPMRAG